jgi:hypothetical protein
VVAAQDKLNLKNKYIRKPYVLRKHYRRAIPHSQNPPMQP